MEGKKDILTLEDIKQLVDCFYEKVRADELLAPIFNERIQDNWSGHLQKMYSFWETILLDQSTYQGTPFLPHAELPVEHSHFKKWVNLFTRTVDSLYVGHKAEEAKWRAMKMAEMFESKIQHFRKQGFKNLL